MWSLFIFYSTVCGWSSLLQSVPTYWQCYSRDVVLYWGNYTIRQIVVPTRYLIRMFDILLHCLLTWLLIYSASPVYCHLWFLMSSHKLRYRWSIWISLSYKVVDIQSHGDFEVWNSCHNDWTHNCYWWSVETAPPISHGFWDITCQKLAIFPLKMIWTSVFGFKGKAGTIQ